MLGTILGSLALMTAVTVIARRKAHERFGSASRLSHQDRKTLRILLALHGHPLPPPALNRITGVEDPALLEKLQAHGLIVLAQEYQPGQGLVYRDGKAVERWSLRNRGEVRLIDLLGRADVLTHDVGWSLIGKLPKVPAESLQLAALRLLLATNRGLTNGQGLEEACGLEGRAVGTLFFLLMQQELIKSLKGELDVNGKEREFQYTITEEGKTWLSNALNHFTASK